MKGFIFIIFLFFSLLLFKWQANADMLFLNRGPVDASEIAEMPNEPKGSQYFIVQFRGPVFESQKEKVMALGGEILAYIPMNAFIARMPLQIKKRIEQLPFVQWIGFFKQEYRVSPRYQQTSIFNSDQKIQLIVEFFPGENLDPILEQLRKQGAHISEIAQDRNRIRVSGARANLFFLEHLSAVSWLEEDMEFSPLPMDPHFRGNSLHELTGYES